MQWCYCLTVKPFPFLPLAEYPAQIGYTVYFFSLVTLTITRL